MGSIRTLATKGTLFMDFRFAGQRVREYTALPDTPANRKRLQKALDRIETEIAIGTFDYVKTFGKPLPQASGEEPAATATPVAAAVAALGRSADAPTFREFANQWFTESAVQWRRSYCITQRGALDKYLIPEFGDRPLASISKADVLAFRAKLSGMQARKSDTTLSNRRINAVMKPLRQILNEAADRYEFNSAFRNIKPLRIKRSDVMPFTLEEVQTILARVREDYRPYFALRFFTGMRTGEVHGLKWKYVDFERRLILVRESIVLGEEDDLKTDSSQRDIQMTQIVYEALQAQYASTGKLSAYVFCNQAGNPIDNKNFINRVWAPLLRHLGLAHRKAYQMRHTAATLWLAAGEAPEWIARQLGHTSTEMLFRVYSRFVPNLTRQDGSAIDRLLTSRLATGPLVQLPPPGQGGNVPSGSTQPAGIYVPVQQAAPQPIPKLRGVHKRKASSEGGDAQPPPLPWGYRIQPVPWAGAAPIPLTL